MIKTLQILVERLIALSFLILFTCCSRDKEQLILDDNSSIVFLGNTFSEGFQRHNYFETLLYQNYPGKRLRIRNFGWSADEVNLMPRPLNFRALEDQLSDEKADVIIMSYGLNESYEGKENLEDFKSDLEALLLRLKSKKYNEHAYPQLILISPIAYEQIDDNLPAENVMNANLEMYSKAMNDIADRLAVKYIDVFHPLKKIMGHETRNLTSNGIHLNDYGRIKVTEVLAKYLDFPKEKWVDDEKSNVLRKLINQKNKHFFYTYRPGNSEYLIGRRKDWPGGQTLQNEKLEIETMVTRLDTAVWEYSLNPNQKIWDSVENILKRNSNNRASSADKSQFVPDKSSFIVKEGYEIELYASEENFPIGNPVAMRFDPKGRLWVATMPSYPNYYPGDPPNDKIVILEDVDKDGIADQYKIFADSLYLPLGFELGRDGIFVTQAPDLVFLRDTTGDDKADVKEYLLHGFGTEDAHHSLSNYTWGPDGSLYMHMGTFLHSQVETPYGPRRGAYGTTWRYDPIRRKLDNYISYPYANPWGNVFNEYGDHFIADASTGLCHFGTPLSMAIDYPIKHTSRPGFLTSDFTPKTCGMEIISSSNFPPDVQGDILLNTFVGFQGIRQHRMIKDSSEYIAEERVPLLQSTDPNFRPVDLKFGPDGALYVLDWFNPIVQHGEQGFREEMRDHSHGRIWRIKYSGRSLDTILDYTQMAVDELLNHLKNSTNREKYQIRTQLRTFSKSKILPILKDWTLNLAPEQVDVDLYKLEALWIYQELNEYDGKLLDELLASKNDQVRAAAVRTMYYWKDYVKDYSKRMNNLIGDPSFKVRLETIVALSHDKTEATIRSLLRALELPQDKHITYALKESLKNLQPVWLSMFKKSPGFLKDKPDQAEFLFRLLDDPTLLALPGFIKDDPNWQNYTWANAGETEYSQLSQSEAYDAYQIRHGAIIENADRNSVSTDNSVYLKLETVPGKMIYDQDTLVVKSGQKIVLVFNNEDNMAHNVVIVKPGQKEKIGVLADQMASDKDAYKKNFIPESKDVLYFTPLVNSGKSYKLEFVAPIEKGEYPYICTFPGHWRLMNGILKVI